MTFIHPTHRIRHLALLACTALALPVAAQTSHPHHGHAGHGQHTGSAATAASPSGQASPATPYAGQQQRAIKALSDQETDDLLQGRGMGLAKAAELNGYPGPMHVLEHAQALGLSEEQQSATRRLMAAHKDAVRALGRELVEAERALDTAFAQRRIDAASLTAQTRRIGELQAAIRDAHLQTHLQQTALLTPEQITRYNRLRGYGDTAASAAGHRH